MDTAQVWLRGDACPADWPDWLRSADIEWCRVEITEDGGVVWLDGYWYDGTWRDGEWRSGHWRSGHWHDGTWCGGSWYDGDAWRTDGPPKSGGER